MGTRILILGCVISLAGCRMYGSDDSADLIQARILASAQRLSADLAEAEGDLDALGRAAQEHAGLQPLVERYAATIAHHRNLSSEHARIASSLPQENNVLFSWVGPDRYRIVHAAYGGMIADRQILQDRYMSVLHDLEAALTGENAPVARERARYDVAPPLYARLAASTPQLDQILASVPSAVER